MGRMCSGGRVGRTRPGREGDKQRGDHQKCCRPRPILLPSTSTTCIRGLACVCKMHVLSSVAPLDLCLSLAAAMGPGQCLGGQSRGAGSEAHGRRRRLSASEPAPSCPVRHERSHKLVQRRRGPVVSFLVRIGGVGEGGVGGLGGSEAGSLDELARGRMGGRERGC